MKHKAIIIGAGSIGALKDEKKDNKETDNVLTMAHAFYNNRNIDLKGVVDVDEAKFKAAQERWDVEEGAFFLDSLSKELREDVEIISVSVDTRAHYTILTQILDFCPNVKVVLVEKPFCDNALGAISIKNKYKEKGITLVVNYLRRFDPVLEGIQQTLQKEDLEIYSMIIHYNRGLERDGCHGIDLIRYFLGEITWCKEWHHLRTINDLSEEDPTIPVQFGTDKCNLVYMLPVDAKKVGIFNVCIHTSKGEINIRDYSLNAAFYNVKQGNAFGEYPVLSEKPFVLQTKILTALTYVAENLVDIIENGAKPLCTAEDALAVKFQIAKIKNLMEERCIS